MVDIAEVRVAFVQIAALEEERDGYKREAKRCQEDIDAVYLALRRKVTAPSEQMELREMPASDDMSGSR